MKPALLYLRKYIDENYQHDRFKDSDKKSVKQNQQKNFLQESIFKEKKKYEWQNLKTKQIYFKAPKSFNSSKLQKTRITQDRTLNKTQNCLDTLVIQPKNALNNISIRQPINLAKKQQNKSQQKTNKRIVIPIEKQLKFIISPPKNIESKSSQRQILFQQFQEGNQNTHSPNQNINGQHKIEEQEKITQFSKNLLSIDSQELKNHKENDQTKQVCKSMKKIGYDNLSDYLQQMKKFQKINKKQIKQVCYYPLGSMKRSKPSSQNSQIDTSLIIKKQFQKRGQQLTKNIEVQQNFTPKIIENQLFIISEINESKTLKSNFTKNKKIRQQKIDQKGNISLSQYGKIIVCNCQNKKYFMSQFSQGTDYTSFLKITSFILQADPSKQNNYFIANNQNLEFYGLHFCCLINSTENMKQSFFWIGKPIPHYHRDLIINSIDNFLFEIDGLQMMQNDKIWIVDYNGRSSFITKKMLVKCSQKKPQTNLSLPKKMKPKLSNRISLSQQLAGLDLNESFLKLMTNKSFEFNEATNILKKERNKISTKGAFQMVYQSKEILK